MSKLRLNQTEQNKWFNNILIFLTLPIGIYISQVIGFINVNNGAFDIKFLFPTAFTQGGIVVYVGSFILDYLRKLRK